MRYSRASASSCQWALLATVSMNCCSACSLSAAHGGQVALPLTAGADEIAALPGLVLYTLVSTHLRTRLETRCQALGVPLVAALDPVVFALSRVLGQAARPRPGGQHVMDAAYFERIEALNYTLAHDDGQNPDGWDQADLILLGVSRSSKTPTSIYLANRGYKVANTPLVPGRPPDPRLDALAAAGPAGRYGAAFLGRRETGMRWSRTVAMVEAHAEGEVGRVVMGGVLDVPGATMLDKLAYLNGTDDSLRRFHTLFEQVPCFISVQDRNLRIVDSNGLFKEHFGQNLGGYCYKVYKRRDEPCEQCPVAKTFEDGLVHTSEEIIIDSTGSEVVVLVSSSPLRDSQGRVTEVMEVLTDITEIRLLQDKLASLGQLVGGIAHSIKNVLEGLRGGIYVANLGFRDNSREDIETGWEMVQRNVERISGMILDMLYCAKDRAPRRLPVSLPEMAEDVAELFRARAGQRDLDIETDIDPSMDTILADPKDIHSLLANLITNAMDACASDEDEAKKHFVHIGVSQDGDEAVIRVRDNGIGMDDDTRRKLFRMFFSTKGAFGTGLGLLVCHKVASEHGGAITVDSAPGQGSTFSVRLPLDPDSDAPDADG